MKSDRDAPIPPSDHLADDPEGGAWERLLPRFSLRRKVTVLVLLVSTLVVGLVATRLIPLELVPDGFSAPNLRVWVPWQDAPSQEVVDEILLPLEEELSTVRGIDRISASARVGSGFVWMAFKQDTDMDIAYREVRDRVQRARVRMPDDVEQVFISKEDASGIPVFVLGVSLDPELVDSYNLIQYQIVRPLERLDGVASVEVNGLQEKEILIELDRARTEAAGLDIYRLGQELGQDNFTLASGHVTTGGKKLLLRSVARYESLEDLENRPVSASVKLGDIATISYAEPERNFMVRANSRPAYAVMIMKEGQANTIELTERIQEELGRMEEDPRLAGVGLMTIFSQGEAILESLNTLVDSGKVGALFAIGVLFFFLRRLRMTLIITLSIPVSILLALTVMYFAGETLNIFSLLALMISVGLLVDNSVVVAENIFRLHRQGLGRREACVQGAGEMALAITMATLTTVAVFLPISLIEGQGQFFLQRLSIPISVSLVASLLVALVFVPLSVYLTLSETRSSRSSGRTAGAGSAAGEAGEGRAPGWSVRAWKAFTGVQERLYEMTLGRLNSAYTRLLDVTLRRRRMDLVLVTLLLLGSVVALFASESLRAVLIQEDEQAGFELDIELPDNTTYEESQEYFMTAEGVLEGMAEELGLEGWLVVQWTAGGELQGWFDKNRTTDYTPRQAAEKLRDALPERAGVEFYLGNEDELADDETDSTHAFTLVGDDPAQLETVAEGITDRFLGVEGVLGVQRSGDDSPDELGLVVDRDRAQRQQVNPSAVAGVVGYALRGQALPRYNQDGREVPVRVRFQEEDRKSLDDLSSFRVPTETGQTVALSSITDVSFLDTPERIVRRDKQVARRITLELVEGEEEDTRERLDRMAESMDLPEGISFGGGARASGGEDAKGLLMAALLSIVFIYLLMGYLFESFVLPISILLTIPLASIGVAWIHFLVGKDLDFLGMVGAILLIGVVVNNGIVLVDYVGRLRAEGLSRHEALVLAAQRRFRPIMMTALTTICGMIPLTLGGANSIGLSYTSFGLTLIGGMTSATLLTLLVVPVFYTLVDDLRLRTTDRIARSWRGRGAQAAAGDSQPEPSVAGG